MTDFANTTVTFNSTDELYIPAITNVVDLYNNLLIDGYPVIDSNFVRPSIVFMTNTDAYETLTGNDTTKLGGQISYHVDGQYTIWIKTVDVDRIPETVLHELMHLTHPGLGELDLHEPEFYISLSEVSKVLSVHDSPFEGVSGIGLYLLDEDGNPAQGNQLEKAIAKYGLSDEQFVRLLELGGEDQREMIYYMREALKLIDDEYGAEWITEAFNRLSEKGDLKENCFLPATPITMSDGSTKRIDQIVAGDMVMSYDKDGKLTAGRVKRTMVNTVKYVLDMFGTGVTPGHVYLCGDGKFAGQHVPLIDILRSDGAIIREDGTKVRATTGCDVGSPEDALIWAITGTRGPDGIVVNDSAQIRLGTRIITDECNDISIAEIIKSLGGIVEDGLIKPTPNSDGIPFHWQFSSTLPRPEDYILKRSDLTLNEIYTAAEWEDVQPKLQAPLAGEAGGSFINVPDSVTPPNVPLSFAGTSLEPSMTRKQRRAFQAKARKSSPRVSN